jgi:hypothetical protein
MKFFRYESIDIQLAVKLVYEYYEDKLKKQPYRMRKSVDKALETIVSHASPLR